MTETAGRPLLPAGRSPGFNPFGDVMRKVLLTPAAVFLILLGKLLAARGRTLLATLA
jgi:hypothetical protein